MAGQILVRRASHSGEEKKRLATTFQEQAGEWVTAVGEDLLLYLNGNTDFIGYDRATHR